MEYSDDEIEDAEKAQALMCKKLLEIMDLQADIDGLLRDKPSSIIHAVAKRIKSFIDP